MNLDKIARLADEIKEQVDTIKSIERGKAEWFKPEVKIVGIGPMTHYVVRKDGTVNPHLAGWQREAVKAHDDKIFSAKGKLEGLRYRLVELLKE